MCAYFDENGDEVQGIMTPEEVQAALAEKETEAQKAIEEAQAAQQEQLQAIQEQLAEKETELEKLKNKEINFGKIREKTKEDNVKIEALEKQIDDLKGGLIGQIEKINQVLSDKTIDEAVLRVAGGDKELADKVKFFYKQFSGQPKDEKEMQGRLDNALVLATGGRSNVMNGAAFSSAGSSFGGEPVQSQTKWTDEQKALAKNFGITDADIAKYSGKMPKYAGDGVSNKEWLGR